MLRLLARYIVVVILGGSLAGLGAHSAAVKNLESKLNQLQVSTVQVTDTATPTATATEQGTPTPSMTPTATPKPSVTQCSTGEDNDNSVEEQHESAQAQKHEHEMSNEKSSDEKCEAAGRDVDKTPESSESAPANNEGSQVQNQPSVQSSQPIIIFVRLGKNLGAELQNLLQALQSGSGR